MRTHILQQIIEGSLDLIAAIDTDFRYLAFNHAYDDAMHTLFGRRLFIGQRLADAIEGFPTAQADALELWGRGLTGERFAVERAFERRTYQITFAPLYGPDGRLIGTSQIARDVSDQARARLESTRLNQELLRRVAAQTSALRLSEERFRATFESAPVGIAHLDAEGRWLRINNKMAEILGYEPQDLAHADFRAITHPDDLDADLAQARRLVAGEITTYRMEKRYIRSDRTPVWVVLTMARVPADPPFFLAIVEDISERKAADVQIHAAKAAAERASQSKSRFLAAASHDLRQPAQSLALFTAVLEQRLAGTPEAAVVSRIQQSIDGLSTLLDSMLDVSRLDAGLVVPELADVALDDLLGRLLGEFSAKADAAGVTVTRVPTRSFVRTDRVLLERILRNLIDNAIRYTPAGGRVVVGCRRRAGGLVIEVVDTGIGIPPGEIDAVFEEYHQLDNPARDRSRGLGLGLSIVARLSHLLDHSVMVASQPGRGSRFGIAVPLAPRTGPCPPTMILEPARERLVLVVEDEDLVRSALTMMLEGWGYRVAAAGDGAEAFDCLARETPAAILADYRLANGEIGTELVARLRDRAGRPLPALILTGDTAPERIAEASRSGIGILHKPIAAAALRDRLTGLLKG